MCTFVRYVFVVFLVTTVKSFSFDDSLERDMILKDEDGLLAAMADFPNLRAALEELEKALAELKEDMRGVQARKSLVSTPCWQLGGLCVPHDLCQGSRFLTQVRGCKNKLNVCCFKWNQYRVRDLRDKGASFVGFPWKTQTSYYLNRYGKKNTDQEDKSKKKKKPKKNKNRNTLKSPMDDEGDIVPSVDLEEMIPNIQGDLKSIEWEKSLQSENKND